MSDPDKIFSGMKEDRITIDREELDRVQPRDSISSAADMTKAVRVKGRDWLDGPESKILLDDLKSDVETVAILEGYFAGWRTPPMSVDDIVEYFILDYLGAGTGNGPALRQDPASAIIRCYVGDHERGGADRVLEARELSKASPRAFWFMVTLAKKHSSLCQEVLKSEFKSDVLKLQRGVRDSSVHFAIESWSYVDSVSNYGSITLRAEVPLSSVLSLRAQEHEIVLLRHPWESEIIIEYPQAACETELAPVAPWRDRLAGYLDTLIGHIRSGHSLK
ncbi:hypothetical protein [Arthrobacter bussei]|uniref:Uncharacterized protein n=1 Tax=Arthrobacter bussei TaxID=2594179 RepID=A0A7X1NSG9_9MICC|nr:hypothetical protein [Arthrobacter bussei]MPY12094.1 hypothetical protein [Arthrobacter bussei]